MDQRQPVIAVGGVLEQVIGVLPDPQIPTAWKL
jgi:hypothetical protein